MAFLLPSMKGEAGCGASGEPQRLGFKAGGHVPHDIIEIIEAARQDIGRCKKEDAMCETAKQLGETAIKAGLALEIGLIICRGHISGASGNH